MRDFMVLVNQAESPKEAQGAFEKLNGACRHFLHLEPVLLGHVRMDKKLPEAVCRQQALLRYAPGSPGRPQDIQALAGRLQRVRLNMADWLAPRDVLQAPPYSILSLEGCTFQTPRRPRAGEEYGLSLLSMPASPLWANRHGCAASGRFLAFGGGYPLTRPPEQFTHFKRELL